MTTKKKMLQAAAGVSRGLDIADAFSTDLYTGNGSTQTITNGLDLDGEGGLVWTKARNNAGDHNLFDTTNAFPSYYLRSNTAEAQSTSTSGRLEAFNSDGYTLGNDNPNYSGYTYAAWTFRKAPKFFDIVTYTGDGGSNRTIPHSLGIVPGMVIVKRTDGGAENWSVDHRNLVQGSPLFLNLTQASVSTGGTEFPTEPTDENFYVGTNNTQNGNTFEYVAYIFAHDTDDDSVIQCGSYTGNGSTSGPVVNLGWEPQWVLTKRSSSGGASAEWAIFDNARDPTNPSTAKLFPNESWAEDGAGSSGVNYLSTGFSIYGVPDFINASGQNYIYMAIRAEA
jgi:hypothetical protein